MIACGEIYFEAEFHAGAIFIEHNGSATDLTQFSEITWILFLFLLTSKLPEVISIPTPTKLVERGYTRLYSLSGKTSYRKILWSMEAARLDVIVIFIALKFYRHLGSVNFQSNSKSESRGFEISRNVAVRRFTA